MSLTDPIANMFTQIRNGQMVQKVSVVTPGSTVKMAILKVLEEEGYILGYKMSEEIKPKITVYLKYHNEVPVIESIKRISKPGLRIYKKKDELPRIKGGLGIAILSTPQGVMSDKRARALGQGGEVLCEVA